MHTTMTHTEQPEPDLHPADPVAVSPEASTPVVKRPLFLTPKSAPPRTATKIDLLAPPEPGTLLIITVSEGGTAATYKGRLVFITEKRIRLKEGAGWWDFPLSQVTSLSQAS